VFNTLKVDSVLVEGIMTANIIITCCLLSFIMLPVSIAENTDPSLDPSLGQNPGFGPSVS